MNDFEVQPEDIYTVFLKAFLSSQIRNEVDFAIKVNGASVAFVTFSDGRISIEPEFEHHGSYKVSITITSAAGAEIEGINMQTVFTFTVPLIEK